MQPMNATVRRLQVGPLPSSGGEGGRRSGEGRFMGSADAPHPTDRAAAETARELLAACGQLTGRQVDARDELDVVRIWAELSKPATDAPPVRRWDRTFTKHAAQSSVASV